MGLNAGDWPSHDTNQIIIIHIAFWIVCGILAGALSNLIVILGPSSNISSETTCTLGTLMTQRVLVMMTYIVGTYVGLVHLLRETLTYVILKLTFQKTIVMKI